MGVTPAEKVVDAATVGEEETPDAMSESGTAVGFVDASVNVSGGVERELGAAVTALEAPATELAATAVDEELAAAEAAPWGARPTWWRSWAETRADPKTRGRRASIVAEGEQSERAWRVVVVSTQNPVGGARGGRTLKEREQGRPRARCLVGLLVRTTAANSPSGVNVNTQVMDEHRASPK